jgi:hypothetical protein
MYSLAERFRKTFWSDIEDFFLQRMYLWILSFKTLNKLKLFIECGIPMPQDARTPLLSLCKFLTEEKISIAVFENEPPTLGYRKEPPFPH